MANLLIETFKNLRFKTLGFAFVFCIQSNFGSIDVVICMCPLW